MCRTLRSNLANNIIESQAETTESIEEAQLVGTNDIIDSGTETIDTITKTALIEECFKELEAQGQIFVQTQ